MRRALLVATACAAVLLAPAPGAAAQVPDERIVLRPGDGITFTAADPAPGWCSVGAVGHDREGRLVAVTAGHCWQNGAGEVWKVGEQSHGPIGTETSVYSPGSVDRFGIPTDAAPDYAVVLLDETRVRGSNTSAPDADGEAVVLESIGSLPDGDQDIGRHCAAGHTTGIACGPFPLVDALDLAGTRDVLVNPNSLESWLVMQQGDSGGPLVRTDTGEWLGLAVGYRPDDVRFAVYQRADRIVEDLDARGGIGAGFTLVCTP
ncbi:chymotrypsin family serine protease [Rhodococcus indonesiensis]|uniref:Serine protease n=1 Tax=Rhodococcus indonesiensis TaxID=3055869 RepID=A0ABT7RPV1_9NOCA|nr:serine protease [Rhodococcus indonesiensis]MDM7489660.1 serine protease [Rhodococcus indonesiensis]